MNLIQKLSENFKTLFSKKKVKGKGPNKTCNCKYCQNQDKKMLGKYSDINGNTKG